MICIGVNPRTTSNVTLDGTNQTISKFLIYNVYNGYYLMNIYSIIIIHNTNKLDGYISNNRGDIYNDFQDFIEYFIREYNYLILLFYGDKNRKHLKNSLKNLLITPAVNNCYFIGSANSQNVFTHTGS